MIRFAQNLSESVVEHVRSGVIRHDGVSPLTIDVQSKKISDSKTALDHADVQNVTTPYLNVADLEE